MVQSERKQYESAKLADHREKLERGVEESQCSPLSKVSPEAHHVGGTIKCQLVQCLAA